MEEKTPPTTTTTTLPGALSASSTASNPFSTGGAGSSSTTNSPWELYHVPAGEWDLPVTVWGATQKPGEGGTVDQLFNTAPKGKTTIGAVMEWFAKLPAYQLDQLQGVLLNANLLSGTYAGQPGTADPTTLEAFLKLVEGSAASNKYSLTTFATLQDQGVLPSLGVGVNTSEQGLATELNKAYNTKPTVENITTTSGPDIANTFEHAYQSVMGILPTAAQTDSFVQQFQQQQVNFEEGKDSGKNVAEQDYLQGKTKEANALDNLPGLTADSFVQSYLGALGKQPVWRSGPLLEDVSSGGMGLKGNIHVSPIAWSRGVKDMQAAGILGKNVTGQASAGAGIQHEVLDYIAKNAYQEYQSWDAVTRYLVTGHPQGSVGSSNAFVNQVLQEVQVNANQLLKTASGGLIGSNGSIQAPTVVTGPEATPELQGEAVSASEQANPGQANANALQNSFDAIISRMIRPGGYETASDVNPNTGANMGGGTAGPAGETIDPAMIPTTPAPISGTG